MFNVVPFALILISKFMKNWLITFILLLSFFILHCQNTIVLKFENPKQNTHYKLAIFKNYSFTVIDSFVLQKNEFSKTINLKKELSNYYGEMFLVENNKNEYSFIYSKIENIQILINKENNFSIFKSKENNAYTEWNNILSTFLPTIKQIYTEKKTLSKFDNQYYLKSKQLENKLSKTYYNFEQTLQQLALKMPNTYVGQFLVSISIPPNFYNNFYSKIYDNNIAFLRNHFFDNMNFNENIFLNNSFFWFKLETYLNNYVNYNHTDEFISLDYLLLFFENNPSAYQHIYNYIVKYYLDHKKDYIVEQLLAKNSFCMLDLNIKENKKFEAIKNTQIGSKISDIILKDEQNNLQSLYKTLKKKELTILIFSISWCTHCQEEIPFLANFAEKNPEKISIFSVSLDENKEDWLKFIPKKKLANWKNVAELVSVSKSSIAPQFNISTTPSLFVLNNKGEILFKNIFNTELIETLKERLE